MSERQKQAYKEIYAEFCNGVDFETLVTRFDYPRNTIFEAINYGWSK